MQLGEDSIVRGFFEAADRTPQKIAVYYGEQTISYENLRNDVLRTAQSLDNWSVTTGDRVLFYGEKSIDFICTYLACHVLGAVSVPVDVQMPMDEIAKVYDRVAPRVALFPAIKEWPFSFQEWGEPLCPIHLIS